MAGGDVLPIVLAVAWIATRRSVCTTTAVAIRAHSSRRPDQCEPYENGGGLLLLSNHLLTFQHAHPASIHFRYELELKRRILCFQGRLAECGFAHCRWFVVKLS